MNKTNAFLAAAQAAVVANTTQSFYECANLLPEESHGGFLLKIDDENSNETRSAGIDIHRCLETENGLFALGKKTGRLSGYLDGKQFREIVFFFQKGENPATLQSEEKYKKAPELLVELLSQRVVLILDVHLKVHEGASLKELIFHAA
ncbi:MAG: hypothetical protein JWM20_221 [Patescibacteria group bacterium]|nr:hypothetical protein [Patescibacteria group bacterium]